MIDREIYIQQLKDFIDKPQVKILTGIRRSGKSSVLALLKEELLARGILLRIEDQYPKFVVTMDDFWEESIEGIQHFYISDFLLSKQY